MKFQKPHFSEKNNWMNCDFLIYKVSEYVISFFFFLYIKFFFKDGSILKEILIM